MVDLPPLTLEQTKAVQHLDGPCLVIAGAGTGKTRVITERIAYLINQKQIAPESILALTYTEKAAAEMQNRLDSLLPYGVFGVTTATFHGFCHELLQRHCYKVGIAANARVITSADQISLLRAHLDQLPLKRLKPAFNPVSLLKKICIFIEKAKEEQITPDALKEHIKAAQASVTSEAEQEELDQLQELTDCYQESLTIYHQANVLTYADLLRFTLQVLETSALAKKEEQDRYRYLLIDEFQDTNTIQAKIAYHLAGERANIFVVGDDDQSIYRFRGANIGNILAFRQRFPEAKLITLTSNFRSSQPILDAAYRLIQHNNPHRLEAQEGLDKRLISNLAEGEAPQHHHFSTNLHEQGFVSQTVKHLLEADPELLPQEIAILARSHNHLDGFEADLERHGIAVQRSKGVSFYTLPAVEQALSLLRFLTNPNQTNNLFYLLNGRPFIVPISEIRELNLKARRLNNTLWEQLNLEAELSTELEAAKAYLNNALDSLSDLSPSEALRKHILNSGWNQQLLAAEERSAAEQLNTLYFEAKAFESLHRPVVLAQFLSHVDGLKESGEDISVENGLNEESDGIQLMTIHASKGLEFKVVFIVNLINQRFPHNDRADQFELPVELLQNTSDTVPYEEERRLAYVAITRAKQHLYLTEAERYGANKRHSKPSIFLTEMLESPSQDLADLPLVGGLLTNSKQLIEKGLTFPDVLSPSALEAFEENPAEYLRQYIYKLLPTEVGSLNFGTNVHAALHSFFSARRENSNFDLEQTLRSIWITEGYESKQQEQEAFASALLALNNHIKSLPDDLIPLHTEHKVEYCLPDGLRIKGKIDRIDQLPDGSLAIIDYKTGRKTAIPSLAQKNLPLLVYALALDQAGERVSQISLHYLMNDSIGSVDVNQAFLDKAKLRLEEVIDGMKEAYQTGVFPEKKVWR